jgi:shikimate kinase
MNKLCFLIGAPHCGKSTLGRRVSEIMQLQFYDTDDIVREQIGEVRIGDIFNSYFHSRTRTLEREAILTLTSTLNNPAIIATGAEVALIPD